MTPPLQPFVPLRSSLKPFLTFFTKKDYFLRLPLVSQYALQMSVITSSTILTSSLLGESKLLCLISLGGQKASCFVPRQTSIWSSVPAEETAADPLFNRKIYNLYDYEFTNSYGCPRTRPSRVWLLLLLIIAFYPLRVWDLSHMLFFKFPLLISQAFFQAILVFFSGSQSDTLKKTLLFFSIAENGLTVKTNLFLLVLWQAIQVAVRDGPFQIFTTLLVIRT